MKTGAVFLDSRWIRRGLIIEVEYHALQAKLSRQLKSELIDKADFCNDRPGVISLRRVPEPEIMLEAAREFDVDDRARFSATTSVPAWSAGAALECAPSR